MKSMDELLHEVRACRLCEPHLPLGAKPILQIDPRATLLIAGQAPGRRAHEHGLPFSDASGKRLREWLGFSEAQFYDARHVAILPMGLCFPGSGAGGDSPPRPECAVQWRMRLLERLPNLRLTLAIGQYAVRWHLPASAGRPMTETVAAWRTSWPAVLPMPHPSPRNQRWLRLNPWFEAEVLPALRERLLALNGD